MVAAPGEHAGTITIIDMLSLAFSDKINTIHNVSKVNYHYTTIVQV